MMKNEWRRRNARELARGLSAPESYKEHIIASMFNERSQLVRPVSPGPPVADLRGGNGIGRSPGLVRRLGSSVGL